MKLINIVWIVLFGVLLALLINELAYQDYTKKVIAWYKNYKKQKASKAGSKEHGEDDKE